MKDRKEEIDSLLARNAERQLADFDWNGLSAAISNRLDRAQSRKVSVRKYSFFKIAATIAAAAAVVFTAVTIWTNKTTGTKEHRTGRATVELIASSGSASVEIRETFSKTYVTLDIVTRDRKLAKADIRIIDAETSDSVGETKAAWMIISRTQPVYADNGLHADVMSMICLF